MYFYISFLAHVPTITFVWTNKVRTSITQASDSPARWEVGISPTLWLRLSQTAAGDWSYSDLIFHREGDMMPWPCALVREVARISLSCVAWNCWTPLVHRQLTLCQGFRVLRFIGGVSSLFVRSCLLMSPFPVSCLPFLVFVLLFPVTHSDTQMCQ